MRARVLAARLRTSIRLAAALCLLAALPTLPGAARADLIDRTYLLGIGTGSVHSGSVRKARRGGFGLSGGQSVMLRDWYRPDMPDLTVRMLTELRSGFGITWGLSTGERARKYRVAPALHLGFILQEELWEDAALTLSAATLLGGSLSERPCQADYDAFGTMTVNCRLAATTLAPEDTLDQLLKASGREASWVALDFEYRF